VLIYDRFQFGDPCTSLAVSVPIRGLCVCVCVCVELLAVVVVAMATTDVAGPDWCLLTEPEFMSLHVLGAMDLRTYLASHIVRF
jgi:hypothetical protein